MLPTMAPRSTSTHAARGSAGSDRPASDGSTVMRSFWTARRRPWLAPLDLDQRHRGHTDPGEHGTRELVALDPLAEEHRDDDGEHRELGREHGRDRDRV